MTLTATPATQSVVRMVARATSGLVVRAEGDEPGRTLEGYAAVFNRWTEIESWWEGHFLERLAPGAFDDTLAKRGDRVKVLFNHGFDPSIGDKPLGKPARMEPDETGLWTETPLDRTSYNDDLIESLRSGAIDGMSFRFRVTEEEWKDTPDPSDDNPRGLPERTIKGLDLYEYGPVTFPAYEATTAGVRSADVFRAWRANPEGFLLPTSGAGAQPTAEGETSDDSRPEEAPASMSKQERNAATRSALARLKGLTDYGT